MKTKTTKTKQNKSTTKKKNNKKQKQKKQQTTKQNKKQKTKNKTKPSLDLHQKNPINFNKFYQIPTSRKERERVFNETTYS